MESKRALPRLFIFLLFFLTLFIAVSCRGKGRPSTAPSAGSEALDLRFNDVGPAWPALALLKAGENPLWFELGPEPAAEARTGRGSPPGGPGLIESPELASLTPYAAWPHARFVAGMQVWGDFLVMAINRDGFLVLGKGSDAAGAGNAEAGNAEAFLYRAAGLWDPYTVESFFVWDDKPAVLLYRNDFFIESEAPPAQPQVYVLDRASPVPLGVNVPALEQFPPGGSWEAEVLRRGPDGLWYYRMKEKGKAQNETAYFRTGDLTVAGVSISIGEWRNSDRPENPENVPPLLAAVLNQAASLLGLGEVPAVRAVSPDFEGSRLFVSGANTMAGAAASAENLVLLHGYCRETDPAALAVLSDGRGLYSSGSPSEPAAEVRPFLLPVLPEGFVYTGAALLGDVLAASWEEQQEASVGAAGFMLMTFRSIVNYH